MATTPQSMAGMKRQAPYEERLKRKAYDTELRQLQVELLKLQRCVRDEGQRVVVFEGRDAAGKAGSIKRFTEHLNPGRCGSWR